MTKPEGVTRDYYKFGVKPEGKSEITLGFSRAQAASLAVKLINALEDDHWTTCGFALDGDLAWDDTEEATACDSTAAPSSSG